MLKITTNKHSDGQGMNLTTYSKYLLQTLSMFCLLSTLASAGTSPAQGVSSNSIQNVQYSTLPGNRLQISLELSEQAVLL